MKKKLENKGNMPILIAAVSVAKPKVTTAVGRHLGEVPLGC